MMETINLDYFKQKIYKISSVPKSSLEKIDEKQLSRDEAICEQYFWKFIEYLIKTKNKLNKNKYNI